MKPPWWWRLDNTPVIWVVEDDASIQRLVSDALKIHGFDPRVFGSAEKAYQALGTQAAPTLIILDILLPGMSGIDFVRLVKQNKAWDKIPIVVVSVLSREEGVKDGMADQTTFWINKPFDAGNLIQTIQNVLMSVGQGGKPV
jgi:DNA-binding response OmpR family regulator